MTLLERIHSLQLRAAAADGEDKIKKRAGELTTLRERIGSATANAPAIAQAREELRVAGIEQADYEQRRSMVQGLVGDLIVEIESLLVSAKFDLVKLQGATVESHFKDSGTWVSTAWKAHVPTELPSVDDGLLDALERGGVDVEAIRDDIGRAQETLLVLRNRTMPVRGDVARLQEALSILHSSGERIGELIDPTIADVVVRAQGAGLPYSELTDAVVIELARLGILERFRVVLR